MPAVALLSSADTSGSCFNSSAGDIGAAFRHILGPRLLYDAGGNDRDARRLFPEWLLRPPLKSRMSDLGQLLT